MERSSSACWRSEQAGGSRRAGGVCCAHGSGDRQTFDTRYVSHSLLPQTAGEYCDRGECQANDEDPAQQGPDRILCCATRTNMPQPATPSAPGGNSSVAQRRTVVRRSRNTFWSERQMQRHDHRQSNPAGEDHLVLARDQAPISEPGGSANSKTADGTSNMAILSRPFMPSTGFQSASSHQANCRL